LKHSGEVHSPCAKVLPVAKSLYGAKAPPARRPVGCVSRKIANDLRGFGLLPLAMKERHLLKADVSLSFRQGVFLRRKRLQDAKKESLET